MDSARRQNTGPGRVAGHRLLGRRLSGPIRLLVLLGALLLAAAACSGDDDDSASETEAASVDADMAGGEDAERNAGGVEAGEPAPATTAAESFDGAEDEAAMEEGDAMADGDLDAEAPTPADGSADNPLGAGGTSVTPTAADLGRKLIFTAFVTVGVDDVAAASAEATSIIEGMGGFLFGQETTGGPQASSQLTFKVLPDDFNRALEQLGAVGELRNQSVTTDDVTERIVDLESRIQVAELGVERLRAALEAAPSLEDYAEIERLLLDRESNLEVMRGQLRTLEDRVDLATITLLLTQDRVDNAIELRVSTYDGHDTGASCPGQDQGAIEAGSKTTVCFDIINQGDQTLTDITLTDTVLEIDGETELIEVFGSLDELAPGQAVLVATEIEPERDLRLRTRVTAVPTDGVSPEQVGPSVSTQVAYEIRVFEADRPPGFSDGFSTAVAILGGLWTALVVVLGFLVPLLILVPLLVLLWIGVRALLRRRPARPTPPGGPWGGNQPPPPPSAGPQPAAAVAAPASADAGSPGDAATRPDATAQSHAAPPPDATPRSDAAPGAGVGGGNGTAGAAGTTPSGVPGPPT